MSGLRIDWHGGLWRIWNPAGDQIHEAKTVVVEGRVEFRQEADRQHGYAHVNGACRKSEDGTITINGNDVRL